MDSSGMWPGGSLALGIVVFLIRVLLILVSMPLAKGNVQASRYNYRPIQQYKLSNEERETGWASRPRWHRWLSRYCSSWRAWPRSRRE